MKRLWDNINNSRYFTYFAVIGLAIIKLLFDNFKSSETLLYLIHFIKPAIFSFYIVTLVYLGLSLLTIAIIHLRFDKPFDKWQQDNKGKTLEQLFGRLINPSLLAWTLFISMYGFSIFLTLYIFSWTSFFIFFGAMLVTKTIGTF